MVARRIAGTQQRKCGWRPSPPYPRWPSCRALELPASRGQSACADALLLRTARGGRLPRLYLCIAFSVAALSGYLLPSLGCFDCCTWEPLYLYTTLSIRRPAAPCAAGATRALTDHHSLSTFSVDLSRPCRPAGWCSHCILSPGLPAVCRCSLRSFRAFALLPYMD